MAEKKTLAEALKTTWPYKAVQGLISGVTLPGDVYAGKVDPMSDEGFQRVQELAGVAMTGGIPFGPGNVPGTSLMSGMVVPNKNIRKAYHGTTSGGFVHPDITRNTMDGGVFFGTKPEVANWYASGEGMMGSLPEVATYLKYNDNVAPRVIPGLLSTEKSLLLDKDPVHLLTMPDFMTTLGARQLKSGKLDPSPIKDPVLRDIAGSMTEGWNQVYRSTSRDPPQHTTPPEFISLMKKHGIDSLYYPHEQGFSTNPAVGNVMATVDPSRFMNEWSVKRSRVTPDEIAPDWDIRSMFGGK